VPPCTVHEKFDDPDHYVAVPIQGSLLLLFGATALYLLSTLGIGLFISTVSRTQQQALMSSFFFYLLAIFLSGFMFPIANMPAGGSIPHLCESFAVQPQTSCAAAFRERSGTARCPSESWIGRLLTRN